MIAFYSKTTKPVNILKAFNNKFKDQSQHQSSDFLQLKKEVEAMDKMRAELSLLENTLPGLNKLTEALKNYYRQVDTVQKLFSFVKPDERFPAQLSWHDSFRAEKFGASYNLNYEKHCILFSLAVCYSKLALTNRRVNQDGIKAATQKFLAAASIFAYLGEKESIVSAEDKTMDTAPNASRLETLMMQAQAQTCFLEKAQIENFSIELIAKLARAVAQIYQKAKNCIKHDETLRNWLKHCDYSYTKHIVVQALLFQATACIWQSKAEIGMKHYGKEIALLRLAKTKLGKVGNMKLGNLVKSIDALKKDLEERVDQELKRAVDDNNTIYHDKVPIEKEIYLSLPEGTLLALVKPFDLKELEISNLSDVLRQSAFMSSMDRKMKEYITQFLHEITSEHIDKNAKHMSAISEHSYLVMNKDDAEQGLFNQLLKDVESLKSKGGREYLKGFLEKVTKAHEQSNARHDVVMNLLKNEAAAFDANSRKYSRLWNLAPSRSVAEPYFNEASAIENYLNKASESNQTMVKNLSKLSNSLSFIESQTPQSIISSLPSVEKRFASNAEVQAFRKLYQEVESLMEKKVAILNEEKKKANETSYVDEMWSHCEDGNFEREAIKTLFKDTYNKSRKEIEEKVTAMETEINSKVEEILALGPKLDQMVKKENVLNENKSLLEKYQKALKSFESLEQGLAAGLNFYADLDKLYLCELEAKVTDYVNARQQETEAKISDIEMDMRKRNSGYFTISSSHDPTDPISQSMNQMNISNNRQSQPIPHTSTYQQPYFPYPSTGTHQMPHQLQNGYHQHPTGPDVNFYNPYQQGGIPYAPRSYNDPNLPGSQQIKNPNMSAPAYPIPKDDSNAQQPTQYPSQETYYNQQTPGRRQDPVWGYYPPGYQQNGNNHPGRG